MNTIHNIAPTSHQPGFYNVALGVGVALFGGFSGAAPKPEGCQQTAITNGPDPVAQMLTKRVRHELPVGIDANIQVEYNNQVEGDTVKSVTTVPIISRAGDGERKCFRLTRTANQLLKVVRIANPDATTAIQWQTSDKPEVAITKRGVIKDNNLAGIPAMRITFERSDGHRRVGYQAIAQTAAKE